MNKLLLTFFAVTFASNVFASEVSTLQDMAYQSQEFRDLSIDCLMEIEMDKAKGVNTETCAMYKQAAQNQLPKFEQKVKDASQGFAKYAKSEGVTQSDVKRGSKQLYIIQLNMNNIKKVDSEIKNTVE